MTTAINTLSIANHTINYTFIQQPNHQAVDTLVLLHDSLGCVTLWRDIPALLADRLGCNVFVYDRVGYGQSSSMESSVRRVDYLAEEAHFLRQILEVMQIEKVSLFGHSDGGSIALLFGAFYPENTNRIICEAGHVFVEEITLAGVRAAALQYEQTDLAERLAKYHGVHVDCLFKAWIDTWLSASYRNWNILPLLHTITSPLLFMQGDKDEYGTLAQLDETLKHVNGPTERYVFENIGHTPHKECKEQALDVITSFMQKSFV